MAYYYTRGGKQFGPHSEEELQTFLAQGTLLSHELIWQDGMAAWAPVHAVFRHVPPPPPPELPPQLPPQAYAPPPAYGQQPVMVAPVYTADPRKSRVAYVLLGLFLGGFGVHNFYAGFTGRAVAQLLITIFGFWLIFPLFIVGIWCLIEVIGQTADASGVAFS